MFATVMKKRQCLPVSLLLVTAGCGDGDSTAAQRLRRGREG